MALELTVHPAADLFPMMDEGELADLAERKKANGLRFPIIVDGNVLIDGRNRLAACKLAGVEPTFEELNGRDPVALIADVNLARRNLTKGQAAMGYAFLYPDPEKGGRGKKRNSSETERFSSGRLSQARSVLHFSREVAQSVFAGVTPLDDALEQIKRSHALLSSEAVIERHLQTLTALLKIRDGRLYRATHGTFEAYCRERWGMSMTEYRMIEAFELAANLAAEERVQ